MATRPRAAQRRYVPILRATPAVLDGLAELSAPARLALSPIIEIQPPDFDPKTRAPRSTMQALLARRWPQIDAAWRDPEPVRLDVRLVDASESAGAAAEVQWLAQEAARVRRAVRFTASPELKIATRAAIKTVVQTNERGLCLRIPTGHYRAAGTLTTVLSTELQFYGVMPDEVDLILDERAISRRLLSRTQTGRWMRMLALLPSLGLWRSVTLLGTTKPLGLSRIAGLRLSGGARMARARTPRTEWASWLGVRSAYAVGHGPTAQMPAFGDYAIGHPAYRPIDPRVAHAVAQIWYATESSWLVYRGQRIRDVGTAQYRRLAVDLTGQPEYATAVFSSGDLYINEVAMRLRAPGKPRDWRRAGTSHHLTQTVHQLAMLPPGP